MINPINKTAGSLTNRELKLLARDYWWANKKNLATYKVSITNKMTAAGKTIQNINSGHETGVGFVNSGGGK